MSSLGGYSQTMQASIKPGVTPRTIDIYLKSSASFTQKDESITFTLAIPATVLPLPTMGSAGVTLNNTGPITNIIGLQPNILINNFGATQREVFVSKEDINGSSYYIYTFICIGTADATHTWTKDIEQLIFSIQFNGCTSNCDPINEMLVNLPNGGANNNSYWYFQSNTIGDITNYQNPFYQNTESDVPVNGGSSDGSALSTISLKSAVSLPVKLNLFTAKSNECLVNTIWKVSTEINMSYYEIERSTNGKDFTSVGRVNVTPENNSPKDYSFTDYQAPSGNLFYRLKMISKDGDFAYSNVILVKLNCGGKGNIIIYPTQSNGLFNVELVSGYENAKIRVINSIGQEVASDVSKSLIRKINLHGLASGIYMVQVILNTTVENVRIVLAK